MVITEKYSQMGNGRVRFFANRFLRIFPLYFVVMLMQQLPYSYSRVPTVFTSSLGMSGLSHFSLIMMNFIKFGQDCWQTFVEVFQANVQVGRIDSLQTLSYQIFEKNVCDFHPGALLVWQGWLLASELNYYLIAPLIATAAWYYASAIGIVSLIIRFTFMSALGGAYMGSWRTKFFASILVFFILGHYSYLLYVRLKDWKHLNIGKSVAMYGWILILIYTVFNRGFLVGVEYDSAIVWLFYGWVALSVPFLFAKTKDVA